MAHMKAQRAPGDVLFGAGLGTMPLSAMKTPMASKGPVVAGAIPLGRDMPVLSDIFGIKPSFVLDDSSNVPITEATLDLAFMHGDYTGLVTQMVTGMNTDVRWPLEVAPIVYSDSWEFTRRIRVYAANVWQKTPRKVLPRGSSFREEAKVYHMERYGAAMVNIHHEELMSRYGREVFQTQLALMIEGQREAANHLAEAGLLTVEDVYNGVKARDMGLLEPGKTIRDVIDEECNAWGIMSYDALGFSKVHLNVVALMSRRGRQVPNLVILPAGGLSALVSNPVLNDASRTGSSSMFKQAMSNPENLARSIVGTGFEVHEATIYDNYDNPQRAFGYSPDYVDYASSLEETGRRFLTPWSEYINSVSAVDWSTRNFMSYMAHDMRQNDFVRIDVREQIRQCGRFAEDGSLHQKHYDLVNNLKANLRDVGLDLVNNDIDQYFFDPVRGDPYRKEVVRYIGDMNASQWSESRMAHVMEVGDAKMNAWSPEHWGNAKRLAEVSDLLYSPEINNNLVGLWQAISLMEENLPMESNGSLSHQGLGAPALPYVQAGTRHMFAHTPTNGTDGMFVRILRDGIPISMMQAKPGFATNEQFGTDGSRYTFEPAVAPEKPYGCCDYPWLELFADMYDSGNTRGWTDPVFAQCSVYVRSMRQCFDSRIYGHMFVEGHPSFAPHNSPLHIVADGGPARPIVTFFQGDMLSSTRTQIYGRSSAVSISGVRFIPFGTSADNYPPLLTVGSGAIAATTQWGPYSRVIEKLVGSYSLSNELATLICGKLVNSTSQSKPKLADANDLLLRGPLDEFVDVMFDGGASCVLKPFAKAYRIAWANDEQLVCRVFEKAVSEIAAHSARLAAALGLTEASAEATETKIAGISNFMSLARNPVEMMRTLSVADLQVEDVSEWTVLLERISRQKVSSGESLARNPRLARSRNDSNQDVFGRAPRGSGSRKRALEVLKDNKNETSTDVSVSFVGLRICVDPHRMRAYFSSNKTSGAKVKAVTANNSFFLPADPEQPLRCCYEPLNGLVSIEVYACVSKALSATMEPRDSASRLKTIEAASLMPEGSRIFIHGCGALQPQRLQSDGDMVINSGSAGSANGIYSEAAPSGPTLVRQNLLERLALVERLKTSHGQRAIGRLFCMAPVTAQTYEALVDNDIPIPASYGLWQPFCRFFMGACKWLQRNSGFTAVGFKALGAGYTTSTQEWTINASMYMTHMLNDDRSLFFKPRMSYQHYVAGMDLFDRITDPDDFRVAVDKGVAEADCRTFIIDHGPSATPASFQEKFSSLTGHFTWQPALTRPDLRDQAAALNVRYPGDIYSCFFWGFHRLNTGMGFEDDGQEKLIGDMTRGVGYCNTTCWQQVQINWDNEKKTYSPQSLSNVWPGTGPLKNLIVRDMKSVYTSQAVSSASKTGTSVTIEGRNALEH